MAEGWNDGTAFIGREYILLFYFYHGLAPLSDILALELGFYRPL